MTEYPAHTEAPAANSDRKKLLLVGGLAAVLLLGGGAYYVTSSGSDATPAATSAPAHPFVKPAAKPVSKKPVKTVTAKKAAVVPPASSVAIGRNPFAVLYSAPVNLSGSTTSTGVQAGGTPTVPTGTTSASTTTAPTATAPTATAPGAGGASTSAYALKLISVDNPAAGYAHHYVFSVDGVKQTVVTNQRFGKNGELVVLNYLVKNNKASGATVQVGDDNPIQVDTGQTRMVI